MDDFCGKYTEVLTTTFQVCKKGCLLDQDDYYFSLDEIRLINRWLLRTDSYKKFKIYCESVPGYEDVFFNAYINSVNPIRINGGTVGFEITATTDKPYGYFETKTMNFEFTDDAKALQCIDVSDEIGSSYPVFTLTMKSGGDLILSNLFSHKTMKITGCQSGEVITIDSKKRIISSSVRADIIKYFNFCWLDIANDEYDCLNTYKSNLNCTMKIEYNPVAKVGL